jgi:hypothetical protein
METFVDVPLSISIPASSVGDPVTPRLRRTVLSSTSSVEVLRVVVVPSTVRSPVTVRLLFTVVVPVTAPIDTVVAALPIFNVVALALNS